MSAHKCSYIVFSQNKKINHTLKLYLSKSNQKKEEDLISKENNPVFLGVIFDKYLNFNKHFSNIFKKCQNRLNIIKILSSRYWKLDEKTLFNIYNLLIGSIFDYSFFTFPCLSKTRLKKAQVIQNSVIRTIFKFQADTPSYMLHFASKNYVIKTIKDRAFEMNSNYFIKATASSNPLIIQLKNEYIRGFSSRAITKATPLCASKDNIKQFYIEDLSQEEWALQ